MNIFIQLIENVLVMKTLPKIIFSVVGVCSYCNIFRSCGWYVIIGKIMSEDTPECAKLHQLRNIFRGNMPPNPLAMCSKTRRTQIPSKMIPK